MVPVCLALAMNCVYINVSSIINSSGPTTNLNRRKKCYIEKFFYLSIYLKPANICPREERRIRVERCIRIKIYSNNEQRNNQMISTPRSCSHYISTFPLRRRKMHFTLCHMWPGFCKDQAFLGPCEIYGLLNSFSCFFDAAHEKLIVKQVSVNGCSSAFWLPQMFCFRRIEALVPDYFIFLVFLVHSS